MRRAIAVVGATVLALGVAGPHALAGGVRHGSATDGDTLRLDNGKSVRVIGIDTPEEGRCGAAKAEVATERFINDGFALRRTKSENTDQYGRLLRTVTSVHNQDLGAFLIRRGLAVARYDSRDGYPWHPLEDRYRRLDEQQRNVCGFDPTHDRRPGSGNGGTDNDGDAFENCDAARLAGAAPVYRGEPGYSPALDADGDGVACE